MSPPEIRRAVVDDAPGIARVHVDSWAEAYAGIVPAEVTAARSHEVRLGQWRETLASEEWLTLVAECGREIVGVSSFEAPAEWDRSAGEAEIRIFYVHPSRWRSGIGRALMASTLAALRELSCRSAVLWVMRDNAPARRFYEALGWTPDGSVGEWAGVPTVRYGLPLA